MRFTTGPYRDLQDKSTIEQVGDTAVNLTTWFMAGCCIVIFFLLIQVRQAQAAEDAWRQLANETPAPERNLWVYWNEGECARLAQWDKQLGFYTSQEQIAGDWWLYSFGDDPPRLINIASARRQTSGKDEPGSSEANCSKLFQVSSDTLK